MKNTLYILLLLLIPSCTSNELPKEKVHISSKEKNEWIPIFNGKDLSGWTPKFKGYKLGENLNNTFRVENGLLCVSYDDWDSFDERFGHLFYRGKYSHYKLRAQYRFHGIQVNKGPAWAVRNNGIMIHGQSPESMEKDQNFPNSLEVQLLGRDTTANLCTPGTQIVLNGTLYKPHKAKSSEPAGAFGEWQNIEVEVHGSRLVRHIVDDNIVLEYTKPQLDDGTLIECGTISIQAESHPCQFRKVQIMLLNE